MRKAQANRKRNNLWLLGAIMHAQGAGEPKEKQPLVVRGYYACAKRRRTEREAIQHEVFQI
ncbi:hypothetical protein BN1326_140181 [Staphylococcus argenteus]|uniref:Uncharacterized protein n=2 Tax=Staphylococcus argenteus TaxID=985002 RepID=A0A7U7PWP2_9STAP|nr:hypothetical protein A4R31_12165 [Staphylococcus argenteus]OMH92980.1 hypothetical protein A4R32_13455 [Staphylococcus argenteus]CRI07261.1 hypothetical protein BN1326_140181 [Staphylococcus argenteus]CRI15000.1 hypothetical protein BN1326_140181 [Staphylococcus argenteus]